MVNGIHAIRTITRRLLAACLLGAAAGCRRSPLTPREAFENGLRDEGVVLHEAAYRLPDGKAARSILFDRETLAGCALYLRAADEPGHYVHIDAEGTVTRDGHTAATLERSGELVLTETATVLYIDDVPLPVNLHGWRTFWLAAEETTPQTRDTLYPTVDVFDSFMRTNLESAVCRLSGGSWALHKRGGGMPTEEKQYLDASFQRAVNPFSIAGEKGGCLTYGDTDWINYHAEACFYFGIPREGRWSDRTTVPTGTDMLVVQGERGGHQVAFGWSGHRGAFVLMTRHAGSPWKVVERWTGARPPLTNWCRIGLRVRAGCMAEGLLDQVPVLQATLPVRIGGPFHLIAGNGKIEADSVRAHSLPAKAGAGDAVHARSRFFAAKTELGGSKDPTQFGEWSKSTSVFSHSRHAGTNQTRKATLTMRFPLMGDFSIESVPFDDEVGPIPPGAYEFAFREITAETPKGTLETDPTFAINAHLSDAGWTLLGFPPETWPSGHREFALRLARQTDHDNRIMVLCGDVALPLSAPLSAPLQVSVSRIGAVGSPPFPHPQHHLIRCANLVNEFFEEAPVDWNWIEGTFRMDCRWACQDQWNFMACGSTGIPYITSKRTYNGDQVHECFMSLRPAQPCDAWDEQFVYNRTIDPKLTIFRQHGGWYVRRDLNVCFCTNGKDPLSGYSLVFGGDDNSETRLLRKGKVVARTKAAHFLFKRSKGHSDVHWKWWKFTVQKYGNRIRCLLNDKVIFDYRDPDPIAGGHVGFWSVRNAFTLARVISVASEDSAEPHVLYVHDDVASDWEPLFRDSVVLTRAPTSDLTRVTAAVGGGFFAVRYTPPVKPIDLKATPVMTLPVRVPDGTAVNLHVDIGGTTYLVPLTGPLGGMKALLGAEHETKECFQLPTLAEATVVDTRFFGTARQTRDGLTIDLLKALDTVSKACDVPEVRSVTIGNTSNTGYLMAGGDGHNRAGSWYEVGVPTFRAK